MPARNRRLPRHLSWPLTPTDLRTVLGETLMDEVHLCFDEPPQHDGTLLRATWNPSITSNYGYNRFPAEQSRVRIAITPLPAGERAHARGLLREQALPELREWLDRARRAPEWWVLTRHSVSWRVTGQEVARREDYQPYPQAGSG
ncbi:hypothetical protein [Streptomyces sp. 1331.2]|uniref:hypothetical protein n=1 Tax=Streptomyces sp. 1331.2 TaxID=1938835 RepID=UPI000BD3EB67|nr:hypothetical protein [Streptomyces sp. 1331.2]SOB85774.1 hypothetical protein SAMN06272789_6075 [Streptomyces sp. 1331.2]